MAKGSAATKLPPPWLKRVWMKEELGSEQGDYPFSLPLFAGGDFSLQFKNPVTIIVGDNGSGKSTLLEAIAALVGFGAMGGSTSHQIFDDHSWEEESGSALARSMGASWLPKIARGFFFRAESFFGLSRYLEEAAYDANALGPRFLDHSHGEGFMRAFAERCANQGVYVFDEPESALSPQRQFEFVKFITEQAKTGQMQAIIATHSPILMAIPGADLMQIERYGLVPVRLEDTAHYRLYREFILYPHQTIEAMIE